MKLVFIACITVTLFAANIFGDPQISSDAGNISLDGIRQIQFIGTVGGKSFFFGAEDYYRWSEADTYCKDAGMHLASLDTEAQYNFIKYNNNSGFLSARNFWTSGRDSQDLNQFVWHDTNTSTINSPYINIKTTATYYACLDFKKTIDTLVFDISGCINSGRFALCET